MASLTELKIIFYEGLYQLQGEIYYRDLNLFITFLSRFTEGEDNLKNISNFTLILSFLGCLYLYHTIGLIKDILLDNFDPIQVINYI